MSDLLREIQDRVTSYWNDAPIPADENPKHTIVREACEMAKSIGLTEVDLDDWALLQQGEPTVAVVNTTALTELQARLQRPDGVDRFRKRLERDRKRADHG